MDTFLLALLEHRLEALRLLLLNLPCGDFLLLGKFDTLARHDLGTARIVIAQHTAEARLGL